MPGFELQALLMGYPYLRPLTACLFWLATLPSCRGTAVDVLPIIDAHSQFDHGVSVERVIATAADAGVTQVLLSSRGKVTTAQVIDLGLKHPTCIVPSVRTKGIHYADNHPSYYRMLDEQFNQPEFRAMSEVILVHAAKGNRAPEWNVAANSPQVTEAIRRAVARGWPVVLHYEFRWLATKYGASARTERLAELKSLASEYPQTPFALIHMGQLDLSDVTDLIGAHPNLVFLTSHANTLSVRVSKQPWTNMFARGELSPPWKALVMQYPDRFVLALDNVWPEDWSDTYVKQVDLWRQALGKLPAEIAHAVAHRNAERLWNLAPAVTGQGCAALQPPR